MKMNLLNSSKYFFLAKYKILSSKFKLPTHSPMPKSQFEQFHHHPPPTLPQFTENKKKKKKLDLLLSIEKIEKQTINTILRPFTTSQLVEILEEAPIFHPTFLHTVLSIFYDDPSRRKLLVTNLGPSSSSSYTSESLREFFSRYGVVEEAQVVGKGGHCYDGFVTFANIEAFLLALKKHSHPPPGPRSEEIEEGFVGFSSKFCVECDDSFRSMAGDCDGGENEGEEGVVNMNRKKKIKIKNGPRLLGQPSSWAPPLPVRRVLLLPISYYYQFY